MHRVQLGLAAAVNRIDGERSPLMLKFSTESLLADIARAVRPAEFREAAKGHLARMDRLNAGMIAESGVQLACRKGCSLCCSLRVDVFAHEVLLIVDHVRARFSSEELAALGERLTAHAEAVLPLTPFEHATTNQPCPMLQEGACSIYEVRPQSCRRHHSKDLSACQYTYDHPTDLETPAAHDRELYRAMSEAMQQNIEVYAEAGYDSTIYELGTALFEALVNPARGSSGWRGRLLSWRRQSLQRSEMAPAKRSLQRRSAAVSSVSAALPRGYKMRHRFDSTGSARNESSALA